MMYQKGCPICEREREEESGGGLFFPPENITYMCEKDHWETLTFMEKVKIYIFRAKEKLTQLIKPAKR